MASLGIFPVGGIDVPGLAAGSLVLPTEGSTLPLIPVVELEGSSSPLIPVVELEGSSSPLMPVVELAPDFGLSPLFESSSPGKRIITSITNIIINKNANTHKIIVCVLFGPFLLSL